MPRPEQVPSRGPCGLRTVPSVRQAGLSFGTDADGAGPSHCIPSAMVCRARLGFLVGGILATALWFATPPSAFTARTLIHVASLQPVILGETPDTRVSQAYQGTQAALAKSRKVLNAALRAPKVKDLNEIQKELDPVAWLEKKINVDYGISPEIMRISMSGPDAKLLPLVVEAVRDAYLNEIVDNDYQGRLARLELPKELYAQHELGLKERAKICGRWPPVLAQPIHNWWP